MSPAAAAALAFQLPPALEAREPPEARGLARDDVRLMVATRSDGEIEHARFRDLPSYLTAGDLLVINTSATLPAAIPARREDGTPVELRFATAAPHAPAGGDWWVVELRSADGVHPFRGGARAGEELSLGGGARVEVVAPYAGGQRLWLARVDAGEPLHHYLGRHGHPIRYGHQRGEQPRCERPAGGVQVAPIG
jgi:S-adenosylmethionine:tRNA ribosyltransferase-isomerase